MNINRDAGRVRAGMVALMLLAGSAGANALMQPKGPGPDDDTPAGKLPGKGPSPSDDDASPAKAPAKPATKPSEKPSPSKESSPHSPAKTGTYPRTKAGESPVVPAPMPVITEVLYAVPGGAAGDASGDGTRHAAGDEFIELANIHDKPIELGGLMLLDKQGYESLSKKGRRGGGIRFTFPKMTLQPGEMVVVFNGFGTSVEGPAGDEKQAAEVNPRFGSSRVLMMNVADERTSLSNSGDVVILMEAESKKIVSVITWGEGALPAGITKDSPLGVVEEVPTVSGGSVMRVGASSRWQNHAEEAVSGLSFSPGWYGPNGKQPVEKSVEKSDQKPAETPSKKPAESSGKP